MEKIRKISITICIDFLPMIFFPLRTPFISSTHVCVGKHQKLSPIHRKNKQCRRSYGTQMEKKTLLNCYSFFANSYNMARAKK